MLSESNPRGDLCVRYSRESARNIGYSFVRSTEAVSVYSKLLVDLVYEAVKVFTIS